MSAPAFTAGPWSFQDLKQKHPRFGIITAKNVIVARSWIEPDARLIAAAPEMYELGEQFERVAEYELRKMRREKADDDEGIRLRQLNLNLIRAALARARGDA